MLIPVLLANAAVFGVYAALALLAPYHGDYRHVTRREMLRRAMGNAWPVAALATFSMFHEQLRPFLDPFRDPALFVLAGVITALFLYVLRVKRRGLYAGVEIAFAISSFIILGMRLEANDPLVTAIGFVAAIYVFVRGMTNLDDAERAKAAATKPASG